MSEKEGKLGDGNGGVRVEAPVRPPMVKVRMFKMTYMNTHFNENQKVWIKWRTGACAALCAGKFRGKWRYVDAWVDWRNPNHPVPEWIEVEVPEKFAVEHGLETV